MDNCVKILQSTLLFFAFFKRRIMPKLRAIQRIKMVTVSIIHQMKYVFGLNSPI